MSRYNTLLFREYKVCYFCLVLQNKTAEASLKPALSRVEGPTSKITRFVPHLQNNLHSILQNPDRIFENVWHSIRNLLGQFWISFQNKSLIFLGEIKLPNSNSTGKSGAQLCNPAAGGVRGGLLGFISYTCTHTHWLAGLPYSTV